MGYYFEKARPRKDLNEEQRGRYEALRSSKEPLAPELQARLEIVRAYIGPLTSGEIMSALEELVQDAFVAWVLAGEDPTKVEWKNPEDLTVPQPPPTEEEKRRAAEWAENFRQGLARDREERLRLQGEPDWDEYFAVHHRVRNFFRRLAARIRGHSNGGC